MVFKLIERKLISANTRLGRSWRWQLLASAAIVGGVATSSNCAWSQVVEDNTVGTTVTSPISGGFQIEGGATRGTNLFHSFREFSVPTNGIAYFNNALSIQNIISRVTGASVSNIDGVIAANGTANLFLINPNGIVFGPNASLKIGGSFLPSTARSVVFDNGVEFSATNPQAPPLLTVNVPLGLQFGANPGSIVNQSRANGDGLRTQQGRTLALVGGEVAIQGGILSAPNGRVELGSVIGNSRVSLTPTNTGYALGYEGVEDFQDIRLLQNAFVSAGGEVGGSMQVQGRNVTLTGGSGLYLDEAGVGEGLSVNATESVQVIGRSADGLYRSAVVATSDSTADVGNLTITTKRLVIRDGAQVRDVSLGAGNGGDLTINASEEVQVIGTSADGQSGSLLSTGAVGTSNAGNLTINTPALLIQGGAQVSTRTPSSRKGGNLTVNAPVSVQVIGTSADGRLGSNLSADTIGTGEAGNLTITTGRLLILGGAQVSAGTFGAGEGGNLTVKATESVQVIGYSADGEVPSNLSTQANRKLTGNSGNLTITTPRLLILGGAYVSADTFGSGNGGNLMVNASEAVQVIGESADGELASYLSADTLGTGKAGDVSITTGRLLILGGAQVSAGTFGAGEGGNLTVNASESVQVIGTSANGKINSNLSTQANRNATGDAGDLTITTGQLLISDGAQVSASTLSAGKGGSLTVNASESVQVIGESADGNLASLLGALTLGTGKAGDVSITTGRLLILGGAQVSAGTFGAGNGANLTVNASESVQVIGTSADGQFPSRLTVRATAGSTAGNLTVETGQMSIRDGAEVTVSSPRGQAGNLTITADSLTLNQGKLTAVTGTSSAEGGANITLQGLDLLRMDNESLISANALENANGGNVTIDSTFIVATSPNGSEGSDIVANAVRGNGGRVNITTQGLFGIEFREKRTPQNDITVSSDFGLAGVFEQNTPDVDPSRGLAELPTDVVDASEQIDRRCTPARSSAQRSSFTITGRGGLPPSPNDVLQDESVVVDWVTLDPPSDNRSSDDTSATPTAPQTPTLTEAQGWMYGPKGEVILTAQAPNVTPHSPTLTPATCHGL